MLIVLNNKCNLTKEEFINYKEGLETLENKHEIVLCPSNIFLALSNLEKIKLGSQNVSSKPMGAYTGEVSAEQLKSFNVKYSIVGHSERRKYQQETPVDINKKIKMLLENDITPIYCVGESKEERQNNQYKEVIKNDILKSLEEIKDEDKNKIIVAYEPIWSIGTGIIPTIDEINEVVEMIKEILPNNRLLYGGSANDKNIATLKNINNIDGYLVGGLSLSIENLKIFLENL